MQGHFSELLYLNKLDVVTENDLDSAIIEVEKQIKLSYNIFSMVAPILLLFILTILLFLDNIFMGLLSTCFLVILILYGKNKLYSFKQYEGYDSMFIDLVYTTVISKEENVIHGRVYDKKYYNIKLEGFDGVLKVSSSLPFANELFVGAPIVAMSEGINDVSGIAGLFISEKFVEDSEIENEKNEK